VIKLNPLTGNFDDVGFPARTITGTTNQVTVTNGDGVSGNPTLSLPQNIHTGASPTFAGLSLNNATPTTWSTPLSIYTPSLSTAGAGTTLMIGKANSTYNAGEIYFNWSADGSANNSLVLGVYGGASQVKMFANTVMTSGNLFASADSTYELGASTRYWSNTYTDRLYLNSTAYLDGGTAGTANLTGSLGILATSGSATHSLTLGSTATGIALYNTADQTTNYERAISFWSSNVYVIGTYKGGTGTVRDISIRGNSSEVLIGTASSNYGVTIKRDDTSYDIAQVTTNNMTKSSGTQIVLGINPTVSQSGTAGYTALKIGVTENTTGSGTKLLADFQVGGVSKFKVDNAGTPELGVSGGGIVMKSPDGTRYRVTVANGGTIAVAAA